LKRLAGKYNFEISVVRKKTKSKTIISSSLIRKLIDEGKMDQVSQFLGRNFSLRGKVIKGRGIGAKLGFPTANVSISNYVMPAQGVYAAWAILGEKRYLSAVNIGFRPTVKKGKSKALEVHITRFRKNILGKVIRIIFLEKIRKEQKFPSLGKLKQAIEKDIVSITSKYSISPIN